MSALYGHTWRRDYGADPASVNGAEWAATLNGLTRQQVDLGLQACRTGGSEFPPSAPRFLAMCLGIPSLARVKHELSKSTGARSKFTWAVWRHIDHYALRATSDHREADRMVRDAYEVIREDVMARRPLVDPPVMIEHGGEPKASEEVAYSQDKTRRFIELGERELGM